jgi:opacity protein-like surface antigen
VTVDVDDSISFAGAIGFKLTPQVRDRSRTVTIPAPISAAPNITNFGAFEVGGSLDSTIAMVNVYYDFDFTWRKIQPFIGAGIGYGWHEGEINNALGIHGQRLVRSRRLCLAGRRRPFATRLLKAFP